MAWDVESLNALCAALPGAEETYPFGDGVTVWKVGGKLFSLIPVEPPPTISLKCDPDLAVSLRARYTSVEAGYHLNKRHWNTIVADGDVPPDELEELVDHSYELVVASLTKAQRGALAEGGG